MALAGVGLALWPTPPPPAHKPTCVDLVVENDMPVMLSELLSFAQECYDKYGDIPVFIKTEDAPDKLCSVKEQRLMRDVKLHESAFVLADYELEVGDIGPKLSLVKV